MESLEPEVECLICVWKAPIMLSTWVGSLGEFKSMIIIIMCSENNEVGVKTVVCKFDNITLIKPVTGKHIYGWCDQIRKYGL